MTTKKSKTWPLQQAREVGEELISLLLPACERIEIAGSIRRQRSMVGDIELVVVSKEAPSTSLWLWRPRLDARILELIGEGVLNYRLNKKGARTFGPLNKLLVHIASGISLDLFSTTEENWGMAWIIRTGPAEFNIKMMSRFITLRMRGHAYGGVTDQHGNELPCPDEETVFRLMGWRYRPPEERG